MKYNGSGYSVKVISRINKNFSRDEIETYTQLYRKVYNIYRYILKVNPDVKVFKTGKEFFVDQSPTRDMYNEEIAFMSDATAYHVRKIVESGGRHD